MPPLLPRSAASVSAPRPGYPTPRSARTSPRPPSRVAARFAPPAGRGPKKNRQIPREEAEPARSRPKRGPTAPSKTSSSNAPEVLVRSLRRLRSARRAARFHARGSSRSPRVPRRCRRGRASCASCPAAVALPCVPRAFARLSSSPVASALRCLYLTRALPPPFGREGASYRSSIRRLLAPPRPLPRIRRRPARASHESARASLSSRARPPRRSDPPRPRGRADRRPVGRGPRVVPGRERRRSGARATVRAPTPPSGGGEEEPRPASVMTRRQCRALSPTPTSRGRERRAPSRSGGGPVQMSASIFLF